ncbi:hypothetical protein D3C84_906710 [compost metagenome]
MVAIQLLGLALALQGAALGADAETRAAEFLPADLHRQPFRRLLAKVHLAKSHPIEKLEAERKCLLVNHKSLTYRIRRAIHQSLAHIKAALTLV